MTAFARALTLAALTWGLPMTAAAQTATSTETPASTDATLPDAADQTAATAAGSGSVLLDLNGATATEAGNCRLTMVTTNRLDKGLTRAAWQVAVFDAEGVVQALPILDFGALAQGKTKVALFELPGSGCDAISRIIVNDVAECRAEDDSDLREVCLTGLATQTRTAIDFGL
ncbi:hypothetical protein [Paracoccus sp. Ld10]|uniref:hypothetical protein n=1 Tax=Paracoccus sp. Ld10 TaxID=649158 RepID=UPI00386E01CD